MITETIVCQEFKGYDFRYADMNPSKPLDKDIVYQEFDGHGFRYASSDNEIPFLTISEYKSLQRDERLKLLGNINIPGIPSLINSINKIASQWKKWAAAIFSKVL